MKNNLDYLERNNQEMLEKYNKKVIEVLQIQIDFIEKYDDALDPEILNDIAWELKDSYNDYKKANDEYISAYSQEIKESDEFDYMRAKGIK